MRRRLMLATIAIGAALFGCQGSGSYDTTADEEYFLHRHQEMIKAYLDGDAEWFATNAADTHFAISLGKIRDISRAEILSNYNAIFSVRKYFGYESTYGPVIKISKDGSMAWVMQQIHAQGEMSTSAGVTEPFEFNSAWISTFEKVDGKWLMTADVSSFEKEKGI